ncbi:hypothetical protein [Labilibacter marinus]|uniref:hypothetical protein n=1 Tax=Labilibacter marinus TaxID=1477105 RepID=UPI00117BB8A4|nr:hypothetical protein [Labilibacter marinus]
MYEIQNQLFENIKNKIDAKYSLVHEVSEALEISYDSTYRRLRGEKQITLQEAFVLSRRFNVSLDAICQVDSNYLPFICNPVEPENFSGIKWLDNALNNVTQFYNANITELTYAAKDPPIFSYFQFPEIAAFKFLFWEKTLFKSKGLAKQKFSIQHTNPSIIDRCKQIAIIALKIPTTEIWNEDTFRILLRQVEYYWVSNYFNTKEDLISLLECLEKWLNHTKKEAEIGMRFLYGKEPKGIPNSYKLYENEIVLNDNTIFIRLPNNNVTFITYNVLGLLSSNNDAFCKNIERFQRAIISKSNLISQCGEKERNRFFNKLHFAIDHFKEKYHI